MTNPNNECRVLTVDELNLVSGGMTNHTTNPVYHQLAGLYIPSSPGGVGAHDTIDTGQGYDPNNLPSGGPGSGPWGN
jgi:hypothetical protein